MPKQRLDLELVSRSLAPSRSQAQILITTGQVFINEQKAITPSQLVTNETKINIQKPLRYVSRGGIKLEHALQEFKINPTNLICLDIGASTGGFTDCLLQHGAKQVYTIDVGTHQLADKLKNNPQVVSQEQTHFLQLPQFPNPKIQLVVIDVSFISCQKILKHLLILFNSCLKIKNCLPAGEAGKLKIVLLLKPQFESTPQENKKGVIKDPKIHKKIIKQFQQFCVEYQIKILNQTTSPIKGPKGNTEFLFYLEIHQ